MPVIAVIPARYASRRFPGKALVPVAGTPLVRRVAQQVRDAGIAHEVVVATDDARIVAAVEDLGVTVALSAASFRSGSDRVAAAVLDRVSDDAVVINVQGDEAMVDAEVLAGALAAMDAQCDISTVAVPLLTAEEAEDPSVVKLLVDEWGCARAFSRHVIGPENRGADTAGGAGAQAERGWKLLAHVGVYAFRRAALARFAQLPTSAGEASEDLEQLRALDNGLRISVWQLPGRFVAINSAADVARVENLLASRASGAGASDEDEKVE